MKVLVQIVSVLFGLVLLGALGIGGYLAVKFSVGLLARMDFQVAGVTVIAAVVALLATLIIARGIRRASQQHTANTFHAERAATYQYFVDVWGTLLQHGRGPEEPGAVRLPEERQALDRLLTLYGSARVVKAHVALRALERELGTQNPSVKSQFAQTLLEIRKDLGSEARGLTAEELLQLFFVDSKVDANKVSALAKASAYQDLAPRVSLAPDS